MRALQWIGWVALASVLIVVVVWSASRWRGATPAQRAALAVLEAPNAFPGRNAFDALWLLRYDVPEDMLAAVANADMAALAAAPPSTPLDIPSSAAGTYADLQPDLTVRPPCGTAGAECLERVREQPGAYAVLVQRNARLIQRAQAFRQYGHLASRLPARPDGPLLPFMSLAWPVTANAERFVRGDTLGAIEATCRDLDTWRRLGVNSDQLITRIYASALTTDGHGRLLAEMLAELPRDTPLPGACSEALAPPAPEEADLCPTMRGEFAWSQWALDHAPMGGGNAAPGRLVFDRAATRALFAERLVGACSVATRQLLERDAPAQDSLDAKPLWQRFECAANPAGCMLADIGGPAYSRYQHRAQDQNARIRLLGTLVWLRASAETGTLAERLAHRPASLRSPMREISVGADGRSLEIAQYDTARGSVWSVPLPAYLVGAEGTD